MPAHRVYHIGSNPDLQLLQVMLYCKLENYTKETMAWEHFCSQSHQKVETILLYYHEQVEKGSFELNPWLNGFSNTLLPSLKHFNFPKIIMIQLETLGLNFRSLIAFSYKHQCHIWIWLNGVTSPSRFSPSRFWKTSRTVIKTNFSYNSEVQNSRFVLDYKKADWFWIVCIVLTK